MGANVEYGHFVMGNGAHGRFGGGNGMNDRFGMGNHQGRVEPYEISLE